jgi:hypothetical protein
MIQFPSRAVLDTCVLFKPTVRGVLLEAALSDLFRPVWSDRILNELAGRLARDVPLSHDMRRCSNGFGLRRGHSRKRLLR